MKGVKFFFFFKRLIGGKPRGRSLLFGVCTGSWGVFVFLRERERDGFMRMLGYGYRYYIVQVGFLFSSLGVNGGIGSDWVYFY